MNCRQTANHLKPRRPCESDPAQVLGNRITENVTSYRKFYSFLKRHYDNVTLPLPSFDKNNTFPGYISVNFAKFFKNKFIMSKNLFITRCHMTKDGVLGKPQFPSSLAKTFFFAFRFLKIVFNLLIFFSPSSVFLGKIWISKVELYPRQLAFAIRS